MSNPEYARMLLLAVPPSFPDYGAVRLCLGLQLTLRGNAEAAIPYFKQVPVDSPAYGDARYELGRLHALNPSLAERYFLQVSSLSEKFRDASYELGNIYFVGKKYALALGYLRLSGRSQSDPSVAAAKASAKGQAFTLSDLRSHVQSSLAVREQSGQANPQSSSSLLFKRGTALKVRTTDDIQAARPSDDLVDENFVDSEVDDLRVHYGAAHNIYT